MYRRTGRKVVGLGVFKRWRPMGRRRDSTEQSVEANVRLSTCLIKHNTTKKYVGKEMQLHLLLISTLDGLKYQFLLTASLPAGKESLETNRRLDEPQK
jgi:hypothetical protein